MVYFSMLHKASSENRLEGFERCANARNPLWNYSPICLRYCEAELDDFGDGVKVQWQFRNDTTVFKSCKQVTSDVLTTLNTELVCETLQTKTVVTLQGFLFF